MVGLLITARIEAEMDGGGEHTRMLARAIIVDRLRTPARAYQLAHRRLADRPMRAASKIAFVEPGLGEQAAHRLDMQGTAAMRGAGDRKLVIAEPERIGCPALDQQNGLHRLDRRAGKHRSIDIAKSKQEPAIGIGDGNRARMPALDEAASDDFDERWIGSVGFTHDDLGSAGQLRARSICLAGAPA